MPSSCDIITKTLYRHLLRTTKPFASPQNGPVLCSLLHRSGLDDDFVEFTSFDQQSKQRAFFESSSSSSSSPPSSSSSSATAVATAPTVPTPTKEENDAPSSIKDVHLSKEEARDLSRTYNELREIRFERERYNQRTYGESSSPSSPLEASQWPNWSSPYTYSDHVDEYGEYHQRSPHAVLYKQILFHLFTVDGDGNNNNRNGYDFKQIVNAASTSRHMVFPSQTVSKENSDAGDCDMGKRLVDIIRNEFRANNKSFSRENNDNANYAADTANGITFSQFYNDSVRKEAGFLALREIQKKLSWAEDMGMNHLFRHQHHQHQRHQQSHHKNHHDDDNNNNNENDNNKLPKISRAKGVHKIPTYPPSSYLQSGAFLIAHPMLTGIFSKSVICILQHTDDTSMYHYGKRKTEMQHGNDNDEDEDEHDKASDDNDNDGDDDDDSDDEIIKNSNGGTYGVIINCPLKVGVPDPNDTNSTKKRNRTLREVMRHDALPEGVKIAFGDCPVRQGGPVNVSIQMLRIASPEEEDKLKIGGTVLPTVLQCDYFDGEGDDGHDSDVGDGGHVMSSALYSDKAIYFGGDIIKAAQAVIDGEIERGM